MAKEEIAYTVSVDTKASGKSLSDLKKEFKETQKELSNLTEGTKEYVAQLQKLGNIKDDIGDLNDQIKAFNPEGKIQAISKVAGGLASGFAAAQGAVALFGGENKDLEKTLVKVQAAMAFSQGIQGLVGLGDAFKTLGLIIKANPIFLIISVVVAIGTALFALKDKIAIVGMAFDAIGKVISYMIAQVKAFTDAIGLSNFALEEMKESIVANNELIKKSTEQRYDSEISALKRAGKETEMAEIRKLNAFVKANNEIIKNLDAKDEEDRKRMAELRLENQKYYTEILNLSDAYHDRQEQQQKEANKKWLEENNARIKAEKEALSNALKESERLWKEYNDKIKADRQKAADEATDLEVARLEREYQKTLDDYEASKALKQIQSEQSLNDKLAFLEWEKNEELKNKELTANEKLLIEQNYEDNVKRVKEDSINAQVDAYQQLGQATMAISDMVFAHQMKQAQGNAGKQREIAKRQFKVNKALGIVNSTIDGVQAVQKALNNPYPLNIILAVASGVAAAANVAKIASTQFNDGGSGGGGDVGGNVPSAPNVAPPTQGSTQLNADGTIKKAVENSQPTIKAVVVETDITKTQKKVGSIETNAKL